ncbi:hypothetical protein AYI70_g5671 [Smittium culicis]|uniref:Uncharacterized protein n=1 Tax=Smittium culicis TaxID=133412 RepID=A0A1R1XTN0_9FUNG|nr:hypothetical protein AYI70_g5671 [Smittium culicis]
MKEIESESVKYPSPIRKPNENNSYKSSIKKSKTNGLYLGRLNTVLSTDSLDSILATSIPNALSGEIKEILLSSSAIEKGFEFNITRAIKTNKENGDNDKKLKNEKANVQEFLFSRKKSLKDCTAKTSVEFSSISMGKVMFKKTETIKKMKSWKNMKIPSNHKYEM